MRKGEEGIWQKYKSSCVAQKDFLNVDGNKDKPFKL